MSAAALINKLHDLGVRVRLVDGDLKIKAPKGALTKELQLEIKASKKDLIEFLSTAGSAQHQPAPALTKAPYGAELTPSFAQQRLWFLDQLEPGNNVYNIPFVVRLRGELNVQALEAAFNDLIARHEALRTRFSIDSNDAPIIVIEPKLTLAVNAIDMSAADDASLRDKLEELNRNAFDLADGPLIRMHLLQVSPTDQVLFILMHHIISDAWSLDVIGRELVTFYSARCKNQTTELPGLPLQFSDYAWWEQNWLKDDELQRQLDFWCNNLAGAPEVLELPTDKTRPAIPANRGGRVQRHFSAEISKKLNELAKAEGGTLFMVLLAAADLLLSRYTGQEDIVVGTPIAGRDRTELEGLIGFFINNLVMRTDLSGNPDFRELVNRAKNTALDAYSHQALPFDKLVEEIQPERNMSHTPIYQVLFMLQNAPNEGGGFADLKTEYLDFDYGTAKFDLTIATIETGEGIAAEFEYNLDLFEHTTIERMMDHFERLLEGIAANPDQSIGSYDMLSDAERHQLLVEWNNTSFDYPADGTIHGLFEQQVALQPNAIAVYHNSNTLSYAELNERANRLAHKLIELGITNETLVAVYTDRSIEMLTGMMAILKAGGAYVPIDPDYPPDRVSYMLSDSEAPVVLANKKTLSSLIAGNAQAICLDDFDFSDSSLSDANPDLPVAAAQLGYTIYTSGSTGLPKGVEIEHRNAVALIEWMRETFTAEEFSGVAASTSVCFDLSVYEIFGTLGLGGRIVLVADALALADLAEDAAVTLINTVPSAIAELVSLQAVPASVKTVNLAGEPLSTSLVNDIYATGTVERVNDLYGPSEDTTYSTWTRRLANVRATIGRPIYNTQAYVLDKHQQPVPVGVPGELFLSGAGVTRGYRNQPELTAEKYIHNPFSDSADARMYGTGDLVRYQPDGNLEYIGRIDHQIKLRGFRIELGEIESKLIDHEAVDKAVVIIREDQPGDKRLVAYIVTDKPPESSELKAHLQTSLPAYMVPAAFVFMTALPLTPNGKIDRKALPAPEWGSENEYTAPRNELEQQLADIWADILGIDAVGVHDDFFELGGHSLLATRLVSRIRKALNTELQVRYIFEHSTIAELVSVIDTSAKLGTVAKIPLANRDRPLPLSYAQQRLWFLDRMAPGGSSYNIPWALRLTGTLNTNALQRALDLIVQRHESLRTVFSETDKGAIQLVREQSRILIQKVDMPDADHESLSQKANELSSLPFDLETDELLRLYCIRINDTDHLLLFVIHHIVSDAWSINVLNQELQNFYAAYLANEKPAAEPLPIQYADFAAWHNQWVSESGIKTQIDYWRNKLSGAPDQLEMPTDHPRPPVQTFHGETVYWNLEGPAVKGLHEIAKKASGTIFMVLLAAYNVLLQRYSGENDIVVGSPTAGRRQAELEHLIGLFVNTLPLRNKLNGNPVFTKLLEQVKQTALDAYDNQDIPFEKLVEELNPQRSLSHSPIFQNAFSFQNAPVDSTNYPSTEVSAFALGYEMAKFDLTLTMWEYDSGIGGSFEYNTDLFDRSTIERMANHFSRLLEGIAANPDQSIGSYDMLSDAERHQLLVEWNNTSFDYPADGTIHGLFEQQVALQPNAIAVYHNSNTLSYAELNERANRLAHKLIELGITNETLVAVYTDRSIEMLTGMMAILKAGGAYVPIDPDYPPDRVSYMLSDSEAPVVLANKKTLSSLIAGNAQAICLDDFDFSDSSLSDANPDLPVAAAQLGYTIYTSGSTGLPKGVEIEHRNAVALIEWMRETFTAEEFSGVAASTSVCFDLSVYEIFGTLGLGGRIVLVADALALADLAEDAAVTLINTVPSAIAELVSLQAVPASVKTVNLAGEPLSTSLVNDIYATGTVERVNDLYGPSEDTTYSTWTRRLANVRATIGRPIYNTQAYVLDKHQQPVPVGVPGELFLSGAGVTRGYRNQPELTAEKYIHNPFSDSADARMYGTGDLVRYQPDGNLEYIGRIDHQIKLRGFRIELGEIESKLIDHEAVDKAVVIIREDQPGDKRLVAYIVTDKPPESSELKAHLQTSLPAYMVPAAFVFMTALPLTPNGKIDRKALPAPEWGSENEYTAPRNELEQQLADIWADILGIDAVGVHDDFFELGGHSLLAIQVIARIRQYVSSNLTLRLLFENPTIAALATAIDSSADKPLPEIAIIPRDGHLPLSFAQQRLWFLHQLMPDNPMYNVPWVQRFATEFDIALLQQVLDQLVTQHETLRSNFISDAGKPVLKINDGQQIPVDHFSVADEAELQAALTRLSRQLFDLDQGPLLSLTVVDIGSEGRDCALMLVMHHIISDAWSLELLTRQLLDNYRSLMVRHVINGAAIKQSGVELERNPQAGNTKSETALSIQYVDYAAWQQRHLKADAVEQQMSYWLSSLEGAPAVLELPTDRPRPTAQSYAGSLTGRVLRPELTAKLRNLSNRQGVTLYMTMLAALNVLLARYSGQEDIVVGTPVSGRSQPALEDIIGLFLNTLAIRCKLSGSPSFCALLSQLKQTVLDAFAHQDLPFERLVEELQPVRDMSVAPIFQVMFTLQNVEMGDADNDHNIAYEYNSAKFDLNISVTDSSDGAIGITCEYATDLFDRSTVERMLGHYEILLDALSEQPEVAIHRVPMLSGDEQQLVLHNWNATAVKFDGAGTLHGLIETQMTRNPDRIALVHNDTILTYSELDAATAGLATELLSAGAGPGVPVAVCLERSADMIISLLAVLRAGSNYVPLDPNYPADRISYMLEDCGAKILVSETGLSTRLPTDSITIICADQSTPLSDIKLPDTVKSDDLAYQIYTSGSTGMPKGVQIEHHAVVNFLHSMANSPGLNKNDTLLSVTTLCFDISILEFFLPLTMGAKLVIAGQSETADGFALQELIAKHSVSMMQATPATWRMMLQAGWQGHPELKVLCGGEALDRSLAEQLEAGNAEVWNMYGPTETTIWSTCHRYAASDKIITIGKPIANTLIYILDQHLQPVPAGVLGELYIGGDGVARGYWQRDELNRAQFQKNPFDDGRIYKTGDRVRWLNDGNLEVLGRTDFQVKLRGFRIELGEIESALAANRDVTQAVVALREDTPGDQRLVAYLISPEGVTLDPAVLREQISSGLPDYMLPTAYVQLERFPLTPNGKINRNALPPPGQDQLAKVEYVPPRNALEESLCALWTDVLGVDKAGIHDDFFALGGHSLIATQLVSRIRDTLNAELALRQLFEHPTVAQLALDITESSSETLAVPAIDRSTRLPLSYAQQRLWFLDQLEPGNPVYNLPWSVRLTGVLDAAALEAAIGDIIIRHETLRTTFVSGEDEPEQVIQPSLSIPLEQITAGDENELQRLLATFSAKTFNLNNGPLMQAQLIRNTETDHVLTLLLHHIIADGWSWNILFRELMAYYNARCTKQKAILPELPIQYVDYCGWERQFLQGEELVRQTDYWVRQLQDAPSLLELPTDYPRPSIQTYNGAHVTGTTTVGLNSKLTQIANSQGCTPYMLLFTAFNLLLARFAGQDDIVVGTPIAGRQRTEFEALIGLFLNTLAIRTDLSGNPSFCELLSRVKQNSLDAYAHQDLPFEKLVEVLQPSRDQSHTPVFQVMFNYHNEPQQEIAYTDLNAQIIEPERSSAKFDISVAMADVGDRFWIDFEYNTDLFNPATIEIMLESLKGLLEDIAKQPDALLSDYALRLQPSTAVQWHGHKETAYTLNAPTLAAQFERQVDKNPAALAVDDNQQTLNYSELNNYANAIAATLAAHGQPATRVAVLLGHDAHMIAGLLGVLKTGAHYLPLDSRQPEQRLQQLLTLGEPQLLLTDHAHQELANSLSDIPVICIEQPMNGVEHINPEPQGDAGDVAYILFTSGSSGAPKGVLQTHKNILHHVQTYANALRLSPTDRLSLFSNYAFDASIQDIFGALLSGASVHPVDLRNEEQTGHSVLALKQRGITVLHATPTVFRHLLDDDEVALPAVRIVVLGGEIARMHDLQLFNEHFVPSAVFVNGYGLTESTVNLQYFADQRTVLTGKALPAGSPVADTRIRLIDRSGAQSSICGAITIESERLFTGYLGLAPRSEPGQYKTGDHARYCADGQILITGRQDQQVKIRGYRVDLIEVEQLITDNPHVDRAAAVIQNANTDNPYLVAFVAKADDEFDIEALRAELRQTMPGYMLPAAFIPVNTIPVTSNGKINRQALPVYNPQRSASNEATLPETATEKLLHDIWLILLKQEVIGIHDNFFDLGGHSLMTIRLLRDIERATGIKLSIADVFEQPTVAGLAAVMDSSGVSDTPRALIPVSTDGDGTPMFMIHMDELNLSWQIHVSRPLYGLNLPYLQGEMPETDLSALAQIYVKEMRSVQAEGPWHITATGFAAMIAAEMGRQLSEQSDAGIQLTVIDPTPIPLSAIGEIQGLRGQSASKPLYFARTNIFQRALCGMYNRMSGNMPMFLRTADNELRMQKATLGYRPPVLSPLLENGTSLTIISSSAQAEDYWLSAMDKTLMHYDDSEHLAEILTSLWQ